MGMLDDAEKRLDEAAAARGRAETSVDPYTREDRQRGAAAWAEFLGRARAAGLTPTHAVERITHRAWWRFRWTTSKRSGARYLSTDVGPADVVEVDRALVAHAYLFERKDYRPVLVTEAGDVVTYRDVFDRPAAPAAPGLVEGRSWVKVELEPLRGSQHLSPVTTSGMDPFVPLPEFLVQYLREHT